MERNDIMMKVASEPASAEGLKDGIELCEDKCTCGAQLRLHTYTFGRKKGDPKPRFYIDCAGTCGKITEWHDTIDEALNEFDSLPNGEVSNLPSL